MNKYYLLRINKGGYGGGSGGYYQPPAAGTIVVDYGVVNCTRKSWQEPMTCITTGAKTTMVLDIPPPIITSAEPNTNNVDIVADLINSTSTDDLVKIYSIAEKLIDYLPWILLGMSFIPIGGSITLAVTAALTRFFRKAMQKGVVDAARQLLKEYLGIEIKNDFKNMYKLFLEKGAYPNKDQDLIGYLFVRNYKAFVSRYKLTHRPSTWINKDGSENDWIGFDKFFDSFIKNVDELYK